MVRLVWLITCVLAVYLLACRLTNSYSAIEVSHEESSRGA